MSINIQARIPESTHWEVKRVAAKNKLSIASFFKRAVEHYLVVLEQEHQLNPLGESDNKPQEANHG